MNYTLRNLLVASALMLLGILAVTSFIRGERADLSRGQQNVQVFLAAKDIPAGTSAKDIEAGGYLETTEILREDAPPNPIGKMSTIKGLTTNETVYKGEVVTTRAFDKSTGLAPTHQIKGNERLYAVPVASASDAAGLIRQGDHVDIIAALETKGEAGTVVTMIARDIEVIETPESLTPKSLEVAAAAPEADGDTKLYVFKSTDVEMANIVLALSSADGHGLILSLRPSNGDTESNIPPAVGIFEVPAGGVPTKVGPDPTVR